MSITLPVTLTVAGDPCPTKGGAVKCAAALLEEEVRRQAGGRETQTQTQSNLAARRRRTTPKAGPFEEGGEARDRDRDRAEAMRLVRCVPAHAAYASRPPPHRADTATPPERWYLYELTLVPVSAADGTGRDDDPLISERMGIDPDCVTRIGVVFGADPSERERERGQEPADPRRRLRRGPYEGGDPRVAAVVDNRRVDDDSSHRGDGAVTGAGAVRGVQPVDRPPRIASAASSSGDVTPPLSATDGGAETHLTFSNRGEPFDVEANFTLIGKGGGKDEDAIVRLSRRTVLRLDGRGGGEGDAARERMRLVREFNHTLSRWKTYGIAGGGGGAAAVSSVGDVAGRERPYMLVPLLRDNDDDDDGNRPLSVDWDMLRRIDKREPTRLLSSVDSDWPEVPFAGKLDLPLLSRAFALLAVAAAAPALTLLAGRPTHHALSAPERAAGIASAILAALFGALAAFLPPRTQVPADLLHNRFLVQRKPARRNVYVTHDGDGGGSEDGAEAEAKAVVVVTALSRMLSDEDASRLTNAQKEYNGRKYRLDLTRATFAEYYMKKYGIRLRHPHEGLIPVHSVIRHVDWDCLSSGRCRRDDDSDGDVIYLVPE